MKSIASCQSLLGVPVEVHVVRRRLEWHILQIRDDVRPDFLETLVPTLSKIDPDVSHGCGILNLIPVLQQVRNLYLHPKDIVNERRNANPRGHQCLPCGPPRTLR